jgi:hypothetical protein
MSFGPSPPTSSSAPTSRVHAANESSTDDEPDVGKLGADLRRRGDEEVDALAIRQTSDDDDDDWTLTKSAAVRNIDTEVVLGSNGGGTAAGLNWSASRALGITWAISGDRLARSTVFSRLGLKLSTL